ncbi:MULTISPECIES: hypothetical protein [unclassified Microcoleus]|uniref:hypothetical protein n=1 Tax=unclassified Microcoleus TaxID=2642155 RepID=UPI002FD31B68
MLGALKSSLLPELLIVLVLITVVKNVRLNATEIWGEVESELFTALITFCSRCRARASEMIAIAPLFPKERFAQMYKENELCPRKNHPIKEIQTLLKKRTENNMPFMPGKGKNQTSKSSQRSIVLTV